jgi:hypothetical protein
MHGGPTTIRKTVWMRESGELEHRRSRCLSPEVLLSVLDKPGPDCSGGLVTGRLPLVSPWAVILLLCMLVQCDLGLQT